MKQSGTPRMGMKRKAEDRKESFNGEDGWMDEWQDSTWDLLHCFCKVHRTPYRCFSPLEPQGKIL